MPSNPPAPPTPQPAPPTLTGLVAARLLDAPLAALTWILVEQGIPVLVAGRDEDAAAAILDALVGALPPNRRPIAEAPGEAGRLIRVAGTLGLETPSGVLRAALAVTTGTSGLAVAVDADDLAGVLAVLVRQGLSDDQASFLGVVLVVERRPEAGDAPRVVAAHYLRPLVQDAGGHPRRLRPAILAAWEPREDRWEDFAWGIALDLAGRCRMRAGDFEAARERRVAALADLVTHGRLDPGGIDESRARTAPAPPTA